VLGFFVYFDCKYHAMEQQSEPLTIKQWAQEDRPREKLLIKGKSALSDAELIGILIGSGSRSLSAVDLAKLILSNQNHDLDQLARLGVNDLVKFKGIGEAKAINIVAALELGRRRKELEPQKKPSITGSKDAYSSLQAELLDLDHEQFWLLLLKRNNELIKKVQLSKGGVSGTIVDTKMIFKEAINSLASAIILAHNHPSGNIKPSQADIKLTKKLKAAGELMDISVLDHIIFTNHGYFSFADESMI
jgi:DNA repair protein RadC